MLCLSFITVLFFFNDTAPTEIYTLSLHDALPISCQAGCRDGSWLLRRAPPAPCRSRRRFRARCSVRAASPSPDRESTRLNSSHVANSYAVFCLKKKKKKKKHTTDVTQLKARTVHM